MASRLLSHRAPAPARQDEQFRTLSADSDVVRAEADFERLRRAWLDLATGPDNAVALAMVGADMERASRAMQNVIGSRRPTVTHGRSHVTPIPACMPPSRSGCDSMTVMPRRAAKQIRPFPPVPALLPGRKSH